MAESLSIVGIFGGGILLGAIITCVIVAGLMIERDNKS